MCRPLADLAVATPDWWAEPDVGDFHRRRTCYKAAW